MNQLGQIAFSDLNNVTWTAAQFELFQQYIQAFQAEILADHRSVGVIWGGQITLVAGLTIQIAAGAALFSNGELVTWATQDLTLAIASAVNPRYDRIELAYSLATNSTVDTNPPVTTVTLDQWNVATPFDNVGTPAGSPVAPALTSGSISIGIIEVTNSEVTLISGNVSQLEDTAFQPSALMLGDASHLLRLNRTRGCFEFSYNGGTTWTSLSGTGLPKQVNFAMSPYTVLPTDGPLEVSTAGGNVVINMPSLAGNPFPVEATKATGDANTVSMTPNGGDLINGSNAADVLAVQYANKTYRPLSASWVIK